jgi:hypothetical protein
VGSGALACLVRSGMMVRAQRTKRLFFYVVTSDCIVLSIRFFDLPERYHMTMIHMSMCNEKNKTKPINIFFSKDSHNLLGSNLIFPQALKPS